MPFRTGLLSSVRARCREIRFDRSAIDPDGAGNEALVETRLANLVDPGVRGDDFRFGPESGVA